MKNHLQNEERQFSTSWMWVAILIIAALGVVFFPQIKAAFRGVMGKPTSAVSESSGQAARQEAVPQPVAVLDPAALDGQRAFNEARDLVDIGPRISGMEGAEKAAKHIAARLKLIGIEPETDEFTEDTVVGKTTFRNVMATLPGDGNDIIIVASHYDTRSGIGDNFVGANDSGSSTGLLLELARVIKGGKRLPSTVLLAFMDGEECKQKYDTNDGLHGSCRLASKITEEGRREKVKAFILLDMIGDKDLSVTIPLNSTPNLASMLLASAREENARDKFSLYKGSILDDHVPFLKARMPAVDIIDFEYGSAPGKNDYWHTEADTMDKLSSESFQTVGRVVLRMLNKLM